MATKKTRKAAPARERGATKKATQAAKTTKARGEDKVDFSDDGTLTLYVAGGRFRFLRPTVDQAHHLIEKRGEVQDGLTALAASADEAADQLAALRERQELIVSWWEAAWSMIGETDAAFPDVGDCPYWLANGTLIGEVTAHWLHVPYGPAGSPTERRQREAEARNQQTARQAEVVTAALAGIQSVMSQAPQVEAALSQGLATLPSSPSGNGSETAD